MKGRSVRENTVLSFQKAATNMVDFIEFDVHVTADGEVVCFHDFEVKLGIGSEVVRLGIPALSYSQLKRCRLFSLRKFAILASIQLWCYRVIQQ